MAPACSGSSAGTFRLKSRLIGSGPLAPRSTGRERVIASAPDMSGNLYSIVTSHVGNRATSNHRR